MHGLSIMVCDLIANLVTYHVGVHVANSYIGSMLIDCVVFGMIIVFVIFSWKTPRGFPRQLDIRPSGGSLGFPG